MGKHFDADFILKEEMAELEEFGDYSRREDDYQINRRMGKEEERWHMQKIKFVQDYLTKNPQEICKKCHLRNCYLESAGFLSDCTFTGLYVKQEIDEETRDAVFEMKQKETYWTKNKLRPTIV
jgi:hypothetical protein